MYPRVVATVSVLISPVVYLFYLHRNLSRKVHHATRIGILTASIVSNIDSIPPPALTESCHMVYDSASKTIPRALLPDTDLDDLITQYLRRNMVRFSHFPQAYVLRLMCNPSERETFSPIHIKSLDFNEGDVVCGLYTVIVRTGGKVEFKLKQIGPVHGRLVTMIEEREDSMIFTTETVSWQDGKVKGSLPLERGLGKWLHELSSWSLLDSGTRYLVGLKESDHRS